MLYWKANFQIPNSGTQAAEVFAKAEVEGDGIKVSFYSDQATSNLLYTEELFNEGAYDVYEYLLTLKEYAQFERI